MSDIRKAFDAYKKASGKETQPDREGSSGKESPVRAEKYVFRPFVKETESREKANREPKWRETGRVAPEGKGAGSEKTAWKKTGLERDDISGRKPLPGAGEAVPRIKGEEKEVSAKEKGGTVKNRRGFEKIAKALLLLGKEEAASVLRHFKPDEIEMIASEMIRVKSIDRKEAAGLLKEINSKAKLKETFSGGVDTARNMLYRAFGEQEGEKILAKALPESREKPFEFLQDVEPLQIKLALKGEPLTMIALVMNYLEPEKSAQLLREFSKAEQKTIIMRMAAGGKIQREVFEKMEQVIKEKVRRQGHVVTQRIDGRSRLANILKFMDLRDEEEIINNIADFDPDLSKEITEQVYTIDIVNSIPDKDLQKVLNEFSDKEIAVILKGREDDVKSRILYSLSQTRRELVRQESEYLGIMRKSEVNIAAREFIDYLKQAEKDGTIVINRSGDLIY